MSSEPLLDDVLPPASEGGEDGGIDLLALAVALISEWRIGAITFLLAILIGFAYVYSLKPQFVAIATFLPQEGHGSANTLASLFSSRGPGSLYIGLLQSRSVQDNTIDRLNLLQVFHTPSREGARSALTGKSTFAEGADSLIRITVRDGDAQNAANIANAYLLALGDLNDKMGTEQSQQTRRFFETQLRQEREALAEAEGALQQTQIRTRQVSEAQAGIGISAIAAARSQIDSLQVQLAALLRGATEQNPQVQRLRSQLAALQGQERALEQGSGSTPVGAAPSALQIPQNALDLARAQREVRYHEALVNSLSGEFETARLSEASARSIFQVVDRAIPPEGKAWPPRKPYLMFALLAAAVLGFAMIVLKLIFRRLMSDPRHRQHLKILRQALWSR